MDEQDRNELEAEFQAFASRLAEPTAKPFHNVLLVRTALTTIPLLAAGLPSPEEGPRANLFFLSHLRSLLGQCCYIQDPDALPIFPSITMANAFLNEHSPDVSVWLSNSGEASILIDHSARQLATQSATPEPTDIIERHLSNFSFQTCMRELHRLQMELAHLPDDPSLLFYQRLGGSFDLASWTKKLSHSCWSFWRTWYQGFLEGEPLDWELQRQVALIEDPVWNASPEAVAAEIERIRAEFDAPPTSKESFPKHEPKSVSHLFKNRVIASATLQGLAAQVTQSIERFHAETGANALPEALEPLAALPALLLAVNSTIQDAPSDRTIASETEDQLRAEIGRLNAKVAQLENELQKASISKPSVFSDAFKKQLGTSLGDWKLYAALCTGLWFVSGDAEGTQRRLENISHYRDMIFGDVSSPSKAVPARTPVSAESTLEI